MINELMEVSMPYSISDLKRLNTKELYHKLIEKYGDEDNFTDTIMFLLIMCHTLHLSLL
mgnify:CR=1 FL=1